MKFFGFQKGKINIIPERVNYSPGEEIKGVVELATHDPLQGKEFSIVLEAYQESFDSEGDRQRRRIFDFKQVLGGEMEYRSLDEPLRFDFAIKVPDMSGGSGASSSTAIRVLKRVFSSRSVIRWTLTARLSVSGFDLKKTIPINIA